MSFPSSAIKAWNGVLEPEAFTRREVQSSRGRSPGYPGRMSDRLSRWRGAAIDVSVHWRFRCRLFAMKRQASQNEVVISRMVLSRACWAKAVSLSKVIDLRR